MTGRRARDLSNDQLIAAALEVNADLQRRAIDLPNPPTKEHTAMTTEPDLGELNDVEAAALASRPTKALVTSLLLQLRTVTAEAIEAHDSWRHARDRHQELEADRDRWRTAHLPDPEAEALAGCVRAIDGMAKAESEARRTQSNYANLITVNPHRYGDHAEALGMPTGRILLALAARYGVPVQAIPQPEQSGPVLVSVPPEYAQAFAGLAEQGWPLSEQGRPR